MDILYCFDEKYIRIAAVSVLSVKRFHPNAKFHLFIVGTLSELNRKSLSRFIKINELDAKTYEIGGYLKQHLKTIADGANNIGMYARLVAASVLPETIHEILYLDGDTLVVSPILIEEDALKNNYLCGVYDYSLPPMGRKRELGLQADSIYINTGVLLMNLDLWRKDDIETKLFQFLAEKPAVLLHDQDAINYVCRGKIGLLPIQFNMTFISPELPLKFAKKICEPFTFRYYTDNDYQEAQNNPCVIHFANEVLGKPWTDVSYIKYTEEWRALDLQTPWGSEKYEKRKYSNYKLVAFYRMVSERIISIFYKKQKYACVCAFFNVFFQFPHSARTFLRGVRGVT